MALVLGGCGKCGIVLIINSHGPISGVRSLRVNMEHQGLNAGPYDDPFGGAGWTFPSEIRWGFYFQPDTCGRITVNVVARNKDSNPLGMGTATVELKPGDSADIQIWLDSDAHPADMSVPAASTADADSERRDANYGPADLMPDIARFYPDLASFNTGN